MENTTSLYNRDSRMMLLTCMISLLVSLLLADRSYADTIVAGRIVDQTTESGVGGTGIRVTSGGRTLGEAVTKNNGKFTVSFDIGSSRDVKNVTLLIEHEEFEKHSMLLTITAGRPDKTAYNARLLPKALSRCQMGGGHGGVVGYFGSEDLAHNVAFALTYSLLIRIQTLNLAADFLPMFVACNKARPRSPLHWGNFAKALGADVFLSGNVEEKTDQKSYDVHIYVSDRFGLFIPPLHTINHSVNLKEAAAAKLEPEIHSAILLAVANGFEQEGEYAKCVEMTVAAEQLLQGPTLEIQKSRQRCQAQLANRGLLRGVTP
jgi:hypothetical protein